MKQNQAAGKGTESSAGSISGKSGRVLKPPVQFSTLSSTAMDSGQHAESLIGETPGTEKIQLQLQVPRDTQGQIVQRVKLVPVQLDTVFGKITSVTIPTTTRPHGTLGNKEGSHTTAWSAIVQGVVNNVLDKSIKKAIEGMGFLLDVAFNLPGAGRVGYMTGYQQQLYYEAKDYATKVSDNAKLSSSYEDLQELISAYLAVRNLTPLAAIDTGENANYKNEGDHLAVLRDFKNQSSDTIRKAIFDLLDLKSLDVYSEPVKSVKFESILDLEDDFIQVAPDRPGLNSEEQESEQIVADVLNQHLMTMAAGFPEAFKKAAITKENVTAFFLEVKKEQKFDGIEEESKEEEISVNPKKTKKLLDIKDYTHTGAESKHHVNTKNAVQVIMKNGLVSDVRVAKQDRPEGVFGSADKKHSTAWISMVNGIIHQVKGKTLINACNALTNVYSAFKNLPGMNYVKFMKDERESAFYGQQFLTGMAVSTAKDSPEVESLQYAIQQLLAFRNIMPFSAADTPQYGSGGKAENTDVIDDYQNQQPNDLRFNFWKLLDPSVVLGFASLVGKNYGKKSMNPENDKREDKTEIERDFPGADKQESANFRGSRVVKQHLATMRALFPEAFEKSQINKKENIRKFYINDCELTEEENKNDLDELEDFTILN